MNKFALSLALAVIGSNIAATPAIAGSVTEALTTCVTDNTSGKDRKELAQWVFITMTAHPEIQPYSNVTDATRDELDRKVAALATKLITENCIAETKAALANEDGGESMKAAFGTLGKLAMQELMTNPAVNASFTRYLKYIDRAKFDSVLTKK